MEKSPYILIDEILELFEKNFGIEMTSQNLYFYIKKKGFPASTGWGNPRKWHRVPVMQWFEEQAKNFNTK